MLPLPGGAGLVPVVTDARRLSEFTFPSGTFRRFDLEQVVRLLLDVLAGLSALHEVVVDGEHFVHGEVSPKHIFIGEHGTAKLVPLTSSHFGSAPTLETTGYSAPELASRRRVDARADLYSVGVMLWEALAGERLFPEAEDDAETVVARKTPPPQQRKRLTRARVAWAQPLCAIAERATEAEPSARFASAVELSNAIAQAVGRHLAKVSADTWQDEAPTPVFQPRLHLGPLRIATPPATVIDLPHEAAPVEEMRVADEATAIAKRPRNAPALALAVMALVVVPAVWLAYGKSFDYRALRAGAAAPTAPVAAIMMLPSVAAPPPSAAASASAAPSAAPATAAAPPVVSSAAAPAPPGPKAKPAARPRLKRSSVPDRADYGI